MHTSAVAAASGAQENAGSSFSLFFIQDEQASGLLPYMTVASLVVAHRVWCRVRDGLLQFPALPVDLASQGFLDFQSTIV